MNNQEIKQLRRLTGVRELDIKVRRNFHKWTDAESRNILFLIKLAIDEIDKISRAVSKQK